MNNFYFIGYELFSIEDKNLIKVFVLDLKNKIVHTIYKNSSEETVTKIKSYKLFDNVSNYITFVIKRNGKISLDIK